MSNQVLFFGDLHGGFDHCLAVVRQYQPKAIVLLGDIQSPAPLHEVLAEVRKLTEVWWIQGNHDTDTEDFYKHLYDSELADYNLDGRVVTIAGVRIAGLGGVFRGKVWHPAGSCWNYFGAKELMADCEQRHLWREGIPLRHRSSIFPETYMQLRTQCADVLVCHEAPSCNRYGFAVLDRLARQMGVKHFFHGHHHDSYDYRGHYQRLGFKAHSVGLRGVMNLEGRVLRRGDEDGVHGCRVASSRHHPNPAYPYWDEANVPLDDQTPPKANQTRARHANTQTTSSVTTQP